MEEKEIELKARELALAEREMKLKEREAEAKIKLEKRGLMFSSPLLIAIVSTVFGTAIGASLQGQSDRQLEQIKFEASIIQSAFEIEDREEAAKQLRFIAESGVIINFNEKKLISLADAPDRIPIIRRAVPTRFAPDSAGSIVGNDTSLKNVRSSPGTDSPVLYQIEHLS